MNLLFAAWLLVAPWLLAGGTAAGAWNGVLSALALAALTLARGPVRERYARWDRWIV